MTTKIIGQFIGFIAMVVSFFIYQQPTRNRILIFKLITDLLWIAHFFILGAFTAMTTTTIAIFRELAFLNNKCKFLSGKCCLYLFCFLFAFSLMFTYNGPISVFPVISSIISTIGFWNKKISNMKVFFFFQSVGMLIYNITIASIAGVFNEIIVIFSLLISLIRQRIKTKDHNFNSIKGRR